MVDAVFAELTRQARGPDERRRLTDLLWWIDRLEHRALDPRAVRLTAFTATAGSHDDAHRAARLLSRVDVPPATLATIERLLVVLLGHDPADDDPDGEVLCDADLAVLGGPAQEYRDHVERLRRDSGLPEALWRRRRLRTARELLDRDSVFRTPEMRASREGRAQLNIAREVAGLSATDAEHPR